uniref:Polycomb protein VEFS-Box domain-containing protein n=1 Tax=Globodera rostochiensis TaxID=31243 RepID=A0A914GZ86_GLORO
MAEYLVVRVVFRFEDAEIGGRHLRKVPSRQSSSGTTDCPNQQHCLRKNGPADDRHREVVMFGAKRIFSFNPGGDLKVINDEASIDLFSDAQLQFSELNSSKLSAAQLSRLIHGNLKPLGGSSPFITVRSHGDSDDDDEEEDEQEEEGNGTRNGEGIGSSTVGNVKIGPKLKKRKIGVNGLEHDDTVDERQNMDSGEGLSLREALEAMDMADNNSGTTAASSTNGLLELPKVIGLKFWLHSPCTARGAVRSSASQLPPGSPPGQQRRRLFVRTAAAVANISLGLFSADERPQPSADRWDASTSSDSVSSSFLLNAPTSLNPSSSSAVSPPFVCRPFPTSHCFFCLASLRLRNLWALQKHLTFCHPRFDFSYETSIRVSPTECLPGFSVTQNVKFDSSNELRSARTAVRPTWLVTKALANKMRTVDNFPIERYTAVASGLSTAEEYIRTKGRFNFETPARIDQPWMRQMSIRKLNDITDLHPAECAMMQMWNTFLLRIRITLFGRRMLYKALRVFVKDSRGEIDRQHLRTHFLLHLTCLLNAGGIDEEERYDLYRRLEHDYDPCGDSRHFVGRELKALEKELRTLSQQQHLVAKSSSISKGHNKIDKLHRGESHQNRLGWRMELRHQQQNISTITAATRLNGGTFKKTVAVAERLQPHRRLLSPSHNVSSSSLCGSSSHFNSCQELRERFAFASSKRIALLWKFLQNYDCPADDFNAYTTNNALPQQKTVAE